MNTKRILLLGILFCITRLNAQIQFLPGYIIKNDGKTLSGKIDYRENSFSADSCLYKDKSGKIIKYSPDQIAGYRFNNDKYFVVREIQEKKKLTEELIKGTLSVYYMKDALGRHYFLERKNVGTMEYLFVERDKLIVENDEEKTVHTLSIYQVDSVDVFKDHPEYKKEIAQMGSLDHRKMVKLAMKYNKEIAKNTNYTIHESDVSRHKIILEPTAGIVNYYKQEDYEDINYFQTGLLGHFELKRNSNRKFYFKTGLTHVTLHRYHFSNFNINYYLKQNLFKIPAQFEYIYNTKTISPKVSMGLNIYAPFLMTIGFSAGTNIRINDFINLGLSYDIDITSPEGMPLPKKLLSQSGMIGLNIKI